MPQYLYDFDGPNTSAGTMPTPAGMPTLEQVAGTWQRYNNRAYTGTTPSANPILAVTVGGGDVDLSANVSPHGGDSLYFRVLGPSDWFRARVRKYERTSSYTVTEYEWIADYSHDWGDDPDHLHEDYTYKYVPNNHTVTRWGTSKTTPPSFPAEVTLRHDHYWDASISQHHSHTYDRIVGGERYTGNSRTTTHYTTTTHYAVYLERSIGGSVGVLASVAVNAPSSLRVRAKGTSIQVFYNGGSSAVASVNDATNLTTARHGIGRGASDFNGQALDNLLLDPLNTAPNAPTGLSPDGKTIDKDIGQRFSWTFVDPDTGDTQSKYDLRYRVAGTTTWTTVSGATANTFRDMAAATFAANDWEWQVRTYDSQGTVGPWSASAFFTAAASPAGPSITDPLNGAVVGEDPYTVSWSAPEQEAYQLRTVADDGLGNADTATILHDTGTVESPGTRSHSTPFPVHGRTEHVQVRVRVAGLWSSYTSHRVDVSYTPPVAPVLLLFTDSILGVILVEIDNPAPSGTEPTVVENEVWRRETGEPGIGIRVAVVGNSKPHVDYRVASGQSYEYRVRAVGDNGTGTWTDWLRRGNESPLSDGLILSDGSGLILSNGSHLSLSGGTT